MTGILTTSEHERARQERANDHALIEAAMNYKPDAATLKEMAKYTPRSQVEILNDLRGLVLP